MISLVKWVSAVMFLAGMLYLSTIVVYSITTSWGGSPVVLLAMALTFVFGVLAAVLERVECARCWERRWRAKADARP